jgi:hypothetical protein
LLYARNLRTIFSLKYEICKLDPTLRPRVTAPALYVNIYNAMSSLVRLENKKYFKYFLLGNLENQSMYPTTTPAFVCSCKFRSRKIGSWSHEALEPDVGFSRM